MSDRPDRPSRAPRSSSPRRSSEERGSRNKPERPAGRGRKPPSRPGDPRRARETQPPEERATPRHWGSLARKGARRLDEDPRGAGTALPEDRERRPWEPEQWIDQGPVKDGSPKARRTGKQQTGRRAESDIDVSVAEAKRAVGPQRAQRVEKALRQAAKAFSKERYREALQILGPLVSEAPGSAAVRELHGLTLYRLGRWKAAAAELEVFRELGGGTEQHPVLADCYRAMRRWSTVEELWDELKEVSPSAELVAEGRIVAAGALADRGRLRESIALLNTRFSLPKEPRWHHLRQAYALADLYERAGEMPRARSLFERIASADPDFVDVQNRLRSLGG